MKLQTYRYGEAGVEAGLYVGVTQFPPRGVARADCARRGYFDVWMPLLGPSRALLTDYQKDRVSFPQFARKYRAEMKRPAAVQAIRLLAATAEQLPVHLGCFCADATRCHRTILRDLVAAAELPARAKKTREFFSPACSMPKIED